MYAGKENSFPAQFLLARVGALTPGPTSRSLAWAVRRGAGWQRLLDYGLDTCLVDEIEVAQPESFEPMPAAHGFPFFDSVRVPIADGRSYHVRMAGAGLPVLFLHGYPLDSRMWNGLMARLANDFLCIAPDLRGFGLNAEERFSFSLADLARDCSQVLDRKSIRQPLVVCGLSMGGYVALEFANQFPDRVAALVLTNTRANSDDSAAAAVRRSTACRALSMGAEAVVSPMLGKLLAPELLRQHETSAHPVDTEVQKMMHETRPSTIAWAQLAMAQRKDFLVSLKNWQVPILAVAGEADPITPPDALQAIVNASGSSKKGMCLVPNSAHLTPMEQPELFARAFRDFLG